LQLRAEGFSVGVTNRRDFLLFRTANRLRVLEIDCQQLYMRCLDAASTCRAADEPITENAFGDGEPPARFDVRRPQDLLADVGAAFTGVTRIRVVDAYWLENSDFHEQFAQLLRTFRAGGGDVEFVRR
jgi:hypothetical protein